MPAKIKFTREFLEKEYVEQGKSTYTIAQENNTYPNRINRELIRHQIPIRDKSEAQSNALTHGAVHPTKGRKRTPEENRAISEGLAESWSGLSPEAKAGRADKAKTNYDNLSEDSKKNLRRKAAQAVRKASKEGSKLEKYLLTQLRLDGYEVTFHAEGFLANADLQCDILLPNIRVVVEVDGLSHYQSIWGEESFRKIQARDSEKNGLLMSAGYKVCRLKATAKSVSDAYMRKLYNLLAQYLDGLDGQPNLVYLSLEN